MARTATQIYCPNCEEIHPCWSENPASHGYESTRRFYRPAHPDVNWFRRIRVCENCGEVFPTVEIQESFLDELVQLREALAEIKANAAEFERDIKQSTKTLTALSKSLKVLRALE